MRCHLWHSKFVIKTAETEWKENIVTSHTEGIKGTDRSNNGVDVEQRCIYTHKRSYSSGIPRDCRLHYLDSEA